MAIEDCEFSIDSQGKTNFAQENCDVTAISNRSNSDADNKDWHTTQLSESCSFGTLSSGRSPTGKW